jgi:energy-coupling factor transport system permease protein
LISAGRVLVAFLASVTFLFTTLADDMLEALIARGASYRIAFVVLSAVQLVPRMRTRAGAILDAQQARGLSLEGSFVRRFRSLVPLIAPVLLGSLVDARERTFALEARGFGARPGRTAYRTVADPPADRWLRLLIGIAAIAVVLFALGILPR